jgi:hypothetical protein
MAQYDKMIKTILFRSFTRKKCLLLEEKAVQFPPCLLNVACSLNYFSKNIPPCSLNVACLFNRDLRVRMYILSLFLSKIKITIVEIDRTETIDPTNNSYLDGLGGKGPGAGIVQHVAFTHSSTSLIGIFEQFPR